MLNLSDERVRHKLQVVDPEAAPCPRCGTWSPRNETRSLYFWEPDLRQPTIMELRAGCYLCPSCPDGKRWFRLGSPEYASGSQYGDLARSLVMDLVSQYKMSLDSATAMAREKLHLPKLNATTVLFWMRSAGDAVPFAARQSEMVEVFSGQMAVDEVYDGEWYQLKATDPINDLELDWRLGEGSPTEEDVREFFQDLKTAGFNPELVVTDGSNLYPNAIAAVWPEADHQRCVFHFIQQANLDLGKAFWDAYRTMPKLPKRKRGRPKKRGRPRLDTVKRKNRAKVRKARFLLLKREGLDAKERPLFTDQERAVLDEAIELCPALGVLRRFVVALHELLGPTTDTHETAQLRRNAILVDPDFAAVPGLAPIRLRLANDDLFDRLTRYLDFENAQKTSNHVERENREFRKRQKSHYRIRSLPSMCALLDLLSARKPIPARPQRLRRKPTDTPSEEEVRQAA